MLYLHIGTHKTGTSALQTQLARNADELNERGIRYLAAGRETTRAHHPLAWSVRGVQNADLSVWDAVRAELVAHPDAMNVVSSEAMWFTDPAGVKAQLAGEGDVRIVMYLRRQDKYLQSLYKQSVASGRKISFAQWLERFHLRGDYLAVVRRWAEQFGTASLIVRPYERDGKTVDTVADFFALLGVEDAADPKNERPHRSNPSPRRELLEFLRAFNQIDVKIDRDKFFFPLIQRNRAYIRTADLLDYEECLTLMSGFAEGNRLLCAEYYRDPATPLFPDLVPFDPPPVWKLEDPEYFAMVVDVLDAVARNVVPGARPDTAMTSDRPGKPTAKRAPTDD